MLVNVTLYSGINDLNNLHINSLLLDTTEAIFELSSDSTFDNVFLQCAEKCGITPPYIPLFGLRDHNLNWVNLCCRLDDYLKRQLLSDAGNHLQVDNVIKLEYRIRFAFNSESEIDEKTYQAYRFSPYGESKKPVMNEKVTKYMFHQQHSDFIEGKLTLKETLSDDLGAALGVAVLDLLRLACEMKCKLDAALGRLENYKKLLPSCIQKRLQSMNFLNRLRVDLKFRHYLRHFAPNSSRWMSCNRESTANPSFFYSRYLRNLELVVNRNHIETYSSVHVTGSSDITKVSIGGDSGLVIGEDATVKPWCDFPEITDMRILHSTNENEQSIWTVSISQSSGQVIDLGFNSITEAENFSTCVNGYYMLVADPHHYLNKKITAPSLVKQLSLNCHGPIPCADAEKLLKNQLYAREGDCLLRQSQESFDEYFINTVIEASSSQVAVRNYKLDKDSNGKLGIFGDDDSYNYDNIASLLKACRASSDQQHNVTLVPFNLNHLLIPTCKSVSTLKIHRCSDAHLRETMQNNDSNEPIIRQIPQKDYAFQKVLGTGKYTTVILQYLTREPNHKVAVKKVYDPQEACELAVKQHVQESFQEAVCLQNLLKNDYIVELKGTMKNMMVLDFVPYGSIAEYLRNTLTPDSLNLYTEERRYGWFLQILWQLTHACNYLEEKGIAHGNIKGQNVLLCQADPEPLIKLSDPGVRTHCIKRLGKNKEYTNAIEPLLQVPWLAREFCWIDGRPDSMSYVSIQGDKWSFATTVYEICCFGKLPDVQPCNSLSVNGNMLSQYLTGGEIIRFTPEILLSSDTLKKTIKQCWSVSPQKRPPYKNILRELGTILASDDIHCTVRPKFPIDPPHETVSIPPLQRFEDRYLVQLRVIGQGHFGHVDLYRYDSPDQDVRIEVAVKSFHRIKNTPGQDLEFNNEIETMRRLDHKHIVKLLGVAEPSLRIVMEYLQDGSLSRYLNKQKSKGKPFSELENDLLNFARQIADGMIALQEQRLIHRDLALRNILLARESDFPDSSLYVKISDFGLSRILRENDYYRQNPNEIPAQWYAPECLNDDKISFRFESDIWSFGVTVWEMFSYGRPPKYSDLPTFSTKALYQLLRKGKRLPKPTECSPKVYNEILKCWQFQPQDRPTFQDLRRNFDNIINHQESHAS